MACFSESARLSQLPGRDIGLLETRVCQGTQQVEFDGKIALQWRDGSQIGEQVQCIASPTLTDTDFRLQQPEA